MYTTRSFHNTWEEYMDAKYGKRIKERCKNFIFFEDGSMKYDFDKFEDHIEAMIDAIKQGEDIDRIISLIYREKIDQPIVKEKILKIIDNEKI